jgi:two-component system, cell cycle sensor histidine kinase and response regulator CckA
VSAGRILLVDDEPQLLSLLQRYLDRMGFAVHACSSGNDALRHFEAEPDGWDLIVADLGMADIPGDQLLVRMLTYSASVRGLLCSGSPYAISDLPPAVRPRVGFLQKPFSPRMLHDALGAMT